MQMSICCFFIAVLNSCFLQINIIVIIITINETKDSKQIIMLQTKVVLQSLFDALCDWVVHHKLQLSIDKRYYVLCMFVPAARLS